jgi:hypothetical protein
MRRRTQAAGPGTPSNELAPRADLQHLLDAALGVGGETSAFEFKEQLDIQRDDHKIRLVKAIGAFANTDAGGHIWIGISDSRLQTWLRGTHHGVSGKHLQAYLDEFVFRFNRRRTPMAAFQSLLGLGSHERGTTYAELVRPPA